MGRTSLLMVIAFNFTFMMVGFRLSDASSNAYEKYCAYADLEQAGLAMESISNIAISNAFMTAKCTTNTVICTDQPFKLGKFSISKNRVNDSFGVQDGYELVATGTYPITGAKYNILKGKVDEIEMSTSIRVRGSVFSQYVFYSESEKISGSPIYWMSGEVCRGKLHTQDYVYVNGNPIFKGKVTTKLGIKKSSPSNNPTFEQGYAKADVQLPSDLNDLTALGLAGGTSAKITGLDTYVQFKIDGSIVVRTEPVGTVSSATTCWNQSSTAMNTGVNSNIPKCTTYANIAAMTASGVLLVQNAALHVKGKLDGKITLGSVGAGSKVWIDSSITYKDSPPSNQNPGFASDDMLGIVAENNISVSVGAEINTPNPKGVTIHASMFSQKGGFGADHYDTRGPCGTIKIVGGVQQKTRMPVGIGGGTDGFTKDYDFDLNLQQSAPPGYPKTHVLISNWVDNTTIPDSFWDKDVPVP